MPRYKAQEWIFAWQPIKIIPSVLLNMQSYITLGCTPPISRDIFERSLLGPIKKKEGFVPLDKVLNLCKGFEVNLPAPKNPLNEIIIKKKLPVWVTNDKSVFYWVHDGLMPCRWKSIAFSHQYRGNEKADIDECTCYFARLNLDFAIMQVSWILDHNVAFLFLFLVHFFSSSSRLERVYHSAGTDNCLAFDRHWAFCVTALQQQLFSILLIEFNRGL